MNCLEGVLSGPWITENYFLEGWCLARGGSANLWLLGSRVSKFKLCLTVVGFGVKHEEPTLTRIFPKRCLLAVERAR